MPRPARPIPPELGDTFCRAAALAAGVTEKRLRARDLEAPFRGVRTKRLPAVDDELDGDPLSRDREARKLVLRRARAYREIMPEHAFFVARTAAAIYELPVEQGIDLDVGVLSPLRAPRRRGIRGVKVATSLVTIREHAGLRVVSPASTWAMLGAELTERELAVVGDAIVRVPRDRTGTARPEHALGTVGELNRAVLAGPRRGVPKLRAAVAMIAVGSMSPLETEYRLDAAAAGLPVPELDVEVFDASGHRIGITEIVYRAYRTLVEIEGDHHRTSRHQWDRDIEKYAAYTAQGWEVVRLTARHVRGDRRAASIVREVLLRHGWHP